MADTERGGQGRPQRWITALLLTLVIAGTGWMVLRSAVGPVDRPQLEKGNFGQMPYDWSVATLDGGEMRVSALKGRPIFLNVWAHWCPPCVAELPSIVRLRQELADTDVAFLLTFMDSAAETRAFMAEQGLDIPVHQPKPMPGALMPEAIPTTYIIARDGTIVLEHTGAAEWDAPTVVEFLRGLAAEPKPAEGAGG